MYTGKELVRLVRGGERESRGKAWPLACKTMGGAQLQSNYCSGGWVGGMGPGRERQKECLTLRAQVFGNVQGERCL